jgi:hypothetical protein
MLLVLDAGGVDRVGEKMSRTQKVQKLILDIVRDTELTKLTRNSICQRRLKFSA